MSEISVFNFDSHAVRTVTDDVTGEPLFVGKDVCAVLGYNNHNNAIKQHCRGVQTLRHVQTAGGVQELRVLTEVDVLRIMLHGNVKISESLQTMILSQVRDCKHLLNAIRDFEVPEECADMYVYAIRNATTGNVKLGISRNPQQRLKQLQTGNDCKLELVAYSKAENRFQDEAALHNRHSDAHIRGEWFNQSAASAIAQ